LELENKRPSRFSEFIKKIGKMMTFKGVRNFFGNFIKGNFLTKLSYLFMGVGHIFRGQLVRGIIYFITQVAFILFITLFGGSYLAMFFENFFTGGNIGRVETHVSDVWDDVAGEYTKLVGDNSFHIMLYGILTLFVILFFIYFYVHQAKESYALEMYKKNGIKPCGFKEDINDFLDNKFHLTLLSLPMVGLFLFTIVPLVTMILIAFTNYDASHEVPEHLFQWV
jgi:arabinogalactan oligomer/maltooligosaccharide transport system permease protein